MTEEIPCTASCSGKCRRVSRQGQVFRCAQALADHLGVKRGAVYQSLSRHGDAEHVGIPKGVPRGVANHTKPITIGPHHWKSRSAMAKDLGLERSWLGKLLKNDPQAVVAKVLKWSITK